MRPPAPRELGERPPCGEAVAGSVGNGGEPKHLLELGGRVVECDRVGRRRRGLVPRCRREASSPAARSSATDATHRARADRRVGPEQLGHASSLAAPKSPPVRKTKVVIACSPAGPGRVRDGRDDGLHRRLAGNDSGAESAPRTAATISPTTCSTSSSTAPGHRRSRHGMAGLDPARAHGQRHSAPEPVGLDAVLARDLGLGRRSRAARRGRPRGRRRAACRRGAAPRARARPAGPRRRRARGRRCARSRRRRACPARASRCRCGRARLRRRGCEPERVARGHRRAAAAAARGEQRLLHLEAHVAALVRGGAVDAEADADAGVEQLAHGRGAGAEAEVRGGAVRDADAVCRRSAATSAGERWTQCAHQTSPSSQPTRSRYSTGVQP